MVNDGSLKFEFQKGSRRNTWELRARAAVSTNAIICSSLYSFKRAFENELAKYKRDSVGFVSNSYKAEIDGEVCNVYFISTRTSDRRLLAIVSKI